MERQRRQDLRRVVTRRNENQQLERTRGADQRWGIYESSLHDYELEFEPLFHGIDNPLARIIHERRKQNKSAVVLELMGDGNVLRGLLPDRGLAITLTDQRKQANREFDKLAQIDVIAGDVLNKKTWAQVLTWLQQVEGGAGKFNLIMERAYGGLVEFPVDPKFYETLMQNLWSVLSSENGLMVLQLPEELKKQVPSMAQRYHIAGIQVDYVLEEMCDGRSMPLPHPIIKIEKSATSPEQLPSLG